MQTSSYLEQPIHDAMHQLTQAAIALGKASHALREHGCHNEAVAVDGLEIVVNALYAQVALESKR